MKIKHGANSVRSSARSTRFAGQLFQRVAPAPRGEYLASSVSRQAPLVAAAAALACSLLSRATSAGARSDRLDQRLLAVARATATVARLRARSGWRPRSAGLRRRACRAGRPGRKDRSDVTERPWRTHLSVVADAATGAAYRGFSKSPCTRIRREGWPSWPRPPAASPAVRPRTADHRPAGEGDSLRASTVVSQIEWRTR